MRKTNPPLLKVYQALFERWGPQHWWPGRTRLEVIVGAILTQNTAWSNVEKAIRNLRRNRALNLQVLHESRISELAGWIRPAGYFNIKARRLKSFVNTIQQSFDGNLRKLFALGTPELRDFLLNVNGIGPETADSILLYAARRPVFVVDAYTRRFLIRHQWLNPNSSYDDIAYLMKSAVPCDIQLYNEYHALIVRLGKEHCRTRPDCAGCPLQRWLPPEKRCRKKKAT